MNKKNNATMQHKKKDDSVLDLHQISDYIQEKLIAKKIIISKKDIEATLLTFLNQLNKDLFKNNESHLEIPGFGSFRTKKRTRIYKSLKTIQALFKVDKTEVIQVYYKTHFTFSKKFRPIIYSLIDKEKTLDKENIKK